MKLLHSVCRTQYAALLAWRGDWAAAESELLAARELAATRPYVERSVDVRLGELRRRQGRTAEAEALFARSPDHPLGLLGLASLALDRGALAAAEERLTRFTRGPRGQDPMDLAMGLELLARVRAARENAPGAREAADALATLAAGFPTLAMRAFASLASGAALLAEARA